MDGQGRAAKLIRGIPQFALAAALPFLLFAIWHSRNAYYPRNDEAFYFQLSQELYLHFKAAGLLEGLRFAYVHKHWKPILHPVVGSLFLGFSRGSVQGALISVLAFYYAILIGYAFAFARLTLGLFRSVLAVCSVVLISWVFGSTTNFNSELPLLACSVATFYHLKRTEGFQRKEQGFLTGVWLCLSACMRPVETGLMFFPPLVILSVRAFRKGRIGVGDFCFPGLALLILLGALVPPPLLGMSWSYGMLATFALLALILMSIAHFAVKKYELNPGFQLVALLSILGTALWYAPGAVTLADWIFSANFGAMSQEMHTRAGMDAYQFVIHVLSQIGWAPWCLLSIAAVAWPIADMLDLAMAFSMFAFPLALGSLSNNADPRYYYSGAAVLALVSAVAALKTGGANGREARARKIRVALVAALVLVEMADLYQLAFDGNLPPRYQEDVLNVAGRPFWDLAARPVDPILKVEQEVVADVGRPEHLKVDIAALSNGGGLVWTADPWGLTIVSRERGLDWTFDRRVQTASSPEQEVDWVHKHYDYVIVGPFTESRYSVLGEDSVLADYLVHQWKRGSLRKLKLRVMDRIHATGPGDEEGDFLLLKTDRAPVPGEDPDH